MRNLAKLTAASALALSLAACNEDNATAPPPAVVVPAPVGFSVAKCLNQEVAPGVSVTSLVVPDTLTVNLAAASGFPNGRRLADPVIDVTLAVIFLDLTRHSATTLAGVPVNPPANDLPFRAGFPYLAAAQGAPPLPPPGGTGFNFRTDLPAAYVQVDRMGMPAVATALIRGPSKTPYNDDSPAIDATGKWTGEITAQLTALSMALKDDFNGLGLTTCGG